MRPSSKRSRTYPLLLAFLTGVSACQTRTDPQAHSSPSSSAKPAPSASAAPVKTTRIVRKVVPKGTVRSDVVTRSMKFDALEGDGKPLIIKERLERTVKVLAASAEAVTQVEVAFGKVTVEVIEGAEDPKVVEDPRSGKTFVLSMELGQLETRTDDGKEVPKATAATMAADHIVLGLPFPLPSLLPEAPIAPGDDFDLSHDLVLALFPVDADGDFDVNKIHIVFDKAKEKAAIFTMQTRFWGTHDGRRIELDLEGTLTARLPTGWPERLSLRGPAKLLAKADDKPAAARPGTATIEAVSTYE